MKVQVLQEGSRPNEIGYHFTDFKGFSKIFNSNILLATNEEDGTWSYTRKKNGMYYRNMNQPDGVRLALDIDKINSRYKVTPFSWMNIRKNDSTAEFEERVSGKLFKNEKGKIVSGTDNILSYIKEVSVSTLLAPDSKVLKLNSEIIDFVSMLDEIEPILIESQFKLEQIIKNASARSTFIKALRTDDIPELQKFIKKEFANNHFNLHNLIERLKSLGKVDILMYTPLVSKAAESVKSVGFNLKLVKDKSNKLQKLSDAYINQLLDPDKILKGKTVPITKYQRAFSSMVQNLNGFDVSLVKGKPFSGIVQIFSDFLKTRGIDFSFQKPNYDSLKSIESGIPESSIISFSNSLRNRVSFINNLMSSVNKLFNRMNSDRKIDTIFKIPEFRSPRDEPSDSFAFPDYVLDIIVDTANAYNRNLLEKTVNMLQMKSAKLSVIFRSDRYMSASQIIFSMDSDPKLIKKIINRLNKYSSGEKWYRAEKEFLTSNLKRSNFFDSHYLLLSRLKPYIDNHGYISGKDFIRVLKDLLANKDNLSKVFVDVNLVRGDQEFLINFRTSNESQLAGKNFIELTCRNQF